MKINFKLSSIICLVTFVFTLAASAASVDEAPKLTGVSGGLCVYLDCGDGHAMADLARGGKFLVHGLSRDASAILPARQYLASQGVAELTTVEPLNPAELPYEKNHVNLMVAENLSELLNKGMTLSNIVQVLAPYGGACLGGMTADQQAQVTGQLAQLGITNCQSKVVGAGSCLVFNKPRPPEMDDWTHYSHAADGNLVSHDTYLGGPNQLQWITGPSVASPLADLGPFSPSSATHPNDPTFILSSQDRKSTRLNSSH